MAASGDIYDEAFYERLTEGLRPGEHVHSLRRALERFEKGYLHNILLLYGRDIEHAAEMLDISPETLVAKMKKYNML